MNLLTKEYKIYRALMNFKTVIILLIFIVFAAAVYNFSVSFLLSSKIEKVQDIEIEIVKEASKSEELNTSISKIDEDLAKKEETSNELKELELNKMYAEQILENIMVSTNTQTKISKLEYFEEKIILSGIASSITNISSIVYNLEEFYNVEISKTQQINYKDKEKLYVFTIEITKKEL